LIDLQAKSLFLAVLAAISQYILAKITTLDIKPNGDKPTFQNQLTRSMGMQMKYVLPIFIGFVAYKISAAVALYWVTSNLFTIGQELYVRRKAAKL
jgi:YidC/Oxa1 family membrane protein insertase